MLVGLASPDLLLAVAGRCAILTYEEEILAKHSAPRLRRNILPRAAKKLNMEFDAQFNKMTAAERDEFLDAIYPEEATSSSCPWTIDGCWYLD
jgi:hypothetical protein